MADRDIFDEELDRLEQQNQHAHQNNNDPFDNWANHTQPQPAQTQSRKPAHIVAICIGLALCFVLGWVLCLVTNENNNDDRYKLLSEVLSTMDFNYYEPISDEEWVEAVEQAGSALMYYAGDRYTFLMSPQSFYNYNNGITNTTTVQVSPDEMFGVAYSLESTGLVVGSVEENSVVFGRLKAGDLVYKMSNVKTYIPVYDEQKVGNNQLSELEKYLYEDGYLVVERNADGSAKTQNYNGEFVFANATEEQIKLFMTLVYQADFHVLRNGEVVADENLKNIQRSKMGITYSASDLQNGRYFNFNYVEYYFDDQTYNISTSNVNGAVTNTYDQRNLQSLGEGVGYIRIKQFDASPIHVDKIHGEQDLCTGNYTNYGGECVTAEMRMVLDLFAQRGMQYLVLDLKGNPGGYVHLTAGIAGMLINEDNLVAEQLVKVKRGGQYLITDLVYRNGTHNKTYAPSTYYNYFPEESISTKRIVVWTDGSSASASELLTGCLLDYGTGVQMGANTFGKGIAQTVDELDIVGTATTPEGFTISYPWAVYYTCARYYSPLGNNIQDVGYAPNQELTASNYTDLWTITKNYWAV